MPRYRPVVATLTLAGLRVSELCALNCEHVDLARRELRVLDAKTPAGVRRVDIHDDLQDELAAYKAARGATWQPGEPAFLNARGKRWTRNAIAQHVIPPALEEANRQRAKAGLPAIRERGHAAHAALHLHRVAVRRRRRPGVRRRPGRARGRDDDQPHLPLRAAAAPARRDRASPAARDARVCRGRRATGTLADSRGRALSRQARPPRCSSVSWNTVEVSDAPARPSARVGRKRARVKTTGPLSSARGRRLITSRHSRRPRRPPRRWITWPRKAIARLGPAGDARDRRSRCRRMSPGSCMTRCHPDGPPSSREPSRARVDKSSMWRPRSSAEKAGKGRRHRFGSECTPRSSSQEAPVCRPFVDGETRTRTGDTTIFSRVLYQLSYLAPAQG